MRICIFLIYLLPAFPGFKAKVPDDPSGVVSGTVTDINGSGVAFATVVLYQAKDTMTVKNEITDSSGRFHLVNIAFGSYFIKITRIGHEDYFSGKFDLGENLSRKELGSIRLKPKQRDLKEVTVTAAGKRLIQTIPGGYLFNADADLTGKNGDALDMLKQVPGIGSDDFSNISLRGGSPLVLINGKEVRLSGTALISYLKSIQGNSIARIEIITSPTAKYPATGEAGIIDIKLKNDNTKGTNGMLGFGINTQPGGVQYGGLNTKKRKLSFSADYNLNYGEGKVFSDIDLINKSHADSAYRFIQHANGKLYNNWQFANAAAGYAPDSTLSFGVDFNFGRFAGLNNSAQLSEMYNRRGSFQENFHQNSRQHSKNRYYMYDITYAKKMRKGELSGYFNVANYRNFNLLHFAREFDKATPSSSLLQNNNTSLGYNFYSCKLDYRLPLHTRNKIEAGIKDDYSGVDNNYISDTLDHKTNTWITDYSISNNFLFHDNTLAVYGTFSGGSGKWEYQAGLRFENYWYKFHQDTSGTHVGFSRSNLFPNLYFRYKFNPGEDISLSLGQRIQRPGYGTLNPFINNSNYNYYNTGNPYLSPAFTCRAELQYTKYWKNYSHLLMASLGYNMVKDVMGQVLLNDGRFDKPYYTYVNYQNSNRLTCSVTGQNSITKWWTINSDINARYATFNLKSGFSADLPDPVFAYSVKVSNNVKFWKNASLQFAGQYLSAYNNFQNKIYPLSIASMAFQKPLNQKWTINASLDDIFYTQRNKTLADGNILYTMTRSRTNSRYAVVRFTYRFGKAFEKTRKVSIESNSRL